MAVVAQTERVECPQMASGRYEQSTKIEMPDNIKPALSGYFSVLIVKTYH
jgi:hypothetical protein